MTGLWIPFFLLSLSAAQGIPASPTITNEAIPTSETAMGSEAIPQSTVITSGGSSYTLIPFVLTDLTSLSTSTTVSTSITETSGGQTFTSIVEVTVQPGGYIWRTDSYGPPVPPPAAAIESATNIQSIQTEPTQGSSGRDLSQPISTDQGAPESPSTAMVTMLTAISTTLGPSTVS
jgi:hypothetical protein